MNPWCRPLTLLAVALACNASAQPGDHPMALLEVVRLKPAESRTIELALPYGKVRSAEGSGRSDLTLYHYPARPGEAAVLIPLGKAVDGGNFKAAPRTVAEGLTMRWCPDDPCLEIAAGPTAAPGTNDVLVTYANFGFEGTHHLGLRLVVLPK